MDSMMEFIMVGNQTSLHPHITTLRENNPDKVFLLYKGCIIQLSEEYARANYTTRKFKADVASFINNEGLTRCENGSLSITELQIILDSNVEKMVLMK